MKPVLAIFGLGNHGKAYEGTRHNAGFMALEKLAKEFGEGDWQDKQKFDGDILEARIGIAPILLVKPKTYMNLSADCVRKVVDFYKLDPTTQIVILSDDIDIPLGELRFRASGGPGTHNGLKSLVDVYGEAFPRIRIGLGEPPKKTDLSSWVLSKMTTEERIALQESFEELPSMIREFIF
ncbi:MAG: aminoacyl-tRNA hydrolase [Candidatus Peregrinibacteria bacterium]|nr:aminoacyl-tRNA hydrolase [Candidatus Peregrinibacteria bacterium]MCB9808402.1 aminoacyl-tRNA hydrolase [Candidatus Peribacteria bacterium]